MYSEWMDAVPLLVEGCHYHNISELQKAVRYYTNNGDLKMVEILNQQIMIERSMF